MDSKYKIDYSLPNLPRLLIGNSPTPLSFAGSFAGNVKLWIKREDLNGISFGGNKVRKAELLFGQVLANGFDAIVLCGAIQSNLVRVFATLAKMFGLDCRVVYAKESVSDHQNFKILRSFGFKFTIIEGKALDLQVEVNAVYENLLKEGKKPYLVPFGGSSSIGSSAFSFYYSELLHQAKLKGLDVSAIILPTSSMGTQAGLIAGRALVRQSIVKRQSTYIFNPEIIGVSVGLSLTSKELILEKAKDVLALLGKDPGLVKETDVNLDLRAHAPGYGLPNDYSEEGYKEFIKLMGVFPDKTYCAKAFGLSLEMLNFPEFREGSDVIFILTGQELEN